ncbi:MAG TPA: glycosyltransferase family A protein [Candidatus Binataceae bacterium]|nr:glycosyltransferase family A protein [Candidatus Binataceae bacterium]
MARVSIIIPAYNAEATIAATIESALKQSHRDLEVVCVDDGSSDRTREIAAAFAPRVRLIEQPNSGPAAARNAGARVTSGDYLAFLDADDLWEPRMLERCVTALDSNPSATLAFCNAEIADSEGARLGSVLAGRGFDHAPSLAELLSQMWPIMVSTAVMRRGAYEKCGGWSEELRGASFRFEDTDFWIRLRGQGPFIYLNELLAVWRFALFPAQLKKLPDYSKAPHVFERSLKERYGVSAEPIVRARMRAPRSILANIGLKALRAGDRTRARAAFALAIRIDPYRLKNYMRWLRTFLPRILVIRLSGAGGRATHDSRPAPGGIE